MRVQFNQREGGPERLVSEAEVVFETQDGPLAGTKLTGFSIWRGAEGDLYVTFPSRAFGASAERRYFDYLRSTDATGEAIKQVKSWILEQYRRTAQAVA